MKRLASGLGLLAVFGLGLLCGQMRPGLEQVVAAQPRQEKADDDLKLLTDLGLSKETIEKVRSAHEAIIVAGEALKLEGKYVPATDGYNSYLILSGGADVLADLESDRGIDPVTFGALNAGKAIPDVADDISFDGDGRLLYRNRVVRIYPQERLSQMAELQRVLMTARVLPTR